MLDLDKNIAWLYSRMSYNALLVGFTVIKTQNVTGGKLRTFKDKQGNKLTVRLEVKNERD